MESGFNKQVLRVVEASKACGKCDSWGRVGGEKMDWRQWKELLPLSIFWGSLLDT